MLIFFSVSEELSRTAFIFLLLNSRNVAIVPETALMDGSLTYLSYDYTGLK